jgi:hypothetical protein
LLYLHVESGPDFRLAGGRSWFLQGRRTTGLGIDVARLAVDRGRVPALPIIAVHEGDTVCDNAHPQRLLPQGTQLAPGLDRPHRAR